MAETRLRTELLFDRKSLYLGGRNFHGSGVKTGIGTRHNLSEEYHLIGQWADEVCDAVERSDLGRDHSLRRTDGLPAGEGDGDLGFAHYEVIGRGETEGRAAIDIRETTNPHDGLATTVKITGIDGDSSVEMVKKAIGVRYPRD